MSDEIKPPESTDAREPAVQSNFADIVKESKENIEGSGKKEPAVKGKRGRPKGSTKARPTVDGSPSTVGSSESAGSVATGAPKPAPNISRELILPIKALSRIPAVNYKIPDLAFNDEEAGACAEALQSCLNAFIPDVENMSPKTAAVVTGMLTFGSIGFSKYQIYSEEMQKRRGSVRERANQEVEATNAPTPAPQEIPGTIPAANYFRRDV